MPSDYAATASLPPHTTATNQRERETIIEFLKEEHIRIKTLRWLLNVKVAFISSCFHSMSLTQVTVEIILLRVKRR